MLDAEPSRTSPVRSLVLALLLAAGTAGMLVQPVWAQDPVESPEAAKAKAADEIAERLRSESWFGYYYRSLGIFFFPQNFLFVALVAMVAVNIWSCQRSNFLNDSFVEQFEGLVKNRQFKEAYDFAKTDESLLGRVLVAGLARISDGYAEASSAMEDAGGQVAMKYEHRLSYLATLANVATMIGLLGTVSGMVASFRVIEMNPGKTPDPAQLAGGVAQALMTTIVGLLQAIPAIFFFTVIKNLVASRFAEAEGIADRLVQPFKSFAGRKPAGAAAGTAPAGPAKDVVT